MLIFNEGLPRAGKSYDAVANHIIPALRARRHVYARLNGLSPYAIAQVAGMPEDVVRGLLHHVEPADVVELFQIRVDEKKLKTLNPALERDSLFVIDECHEFYVASRVDLPPEVEHFFAYHGQFGMDGVLISQWYKRMHDAIRGRVERKHLFRKLNFMKGMLRKRKGATDDPSKRYICRQSIAMEPDKFAVLSSEEHEYRMEVFPCYRSFQDGATNTAAYDPGFSGVFSRKQRMVFIGLVLVMVCLSVYGCTRYNEIRAKGNEAFKAQQAKRVLPAVVPRAVPSGVVQQLPVDAPAVVVQKPVADGRTASVATGATLGASSVASPSQAHDAKIGYFFNLAKTGRTRLAAVVDRGDKLTGLIEWRLGNYNVLDRMDTRDLEEIGFKVDVRPRYATLTADGETLMATMYPLDSPYSVSQEATQAYESRGAGGTPAAMGASSAPAPLSATITGERQVSGYGAAGFRSGEAAPVDAFKMRD